MPTDSGLAFRNGRRTAAPRLDDFAAAVHDKDHAAFGFFASLTGSSAPALAEMVRALDELVVDSVTQITPYGPGPTCLAHTGVQNGLACGLAAGGYEKDGGLATWSRPNATGSHGCRSHRPNRRC